MEIQQEAAQETPTAAEKLFDGNAAAKPAEKVDNAAQASGETKAEETKAEVKTEEAQKAPEKYDLKVPDGSQLSAEQVDKIASYAKEQGLSNEAAQKLLESQHEAISSIEAERQAQFKETVDAWKEQAQKDAEYGGDHFSRNVELAKRVVSRYGSEEFQRALDESGFGNHPELLRVFVRIGQAMGEDRLVTSAAGASSQKSLEDIFYGKQT